MRAKQWQMQEAKAKLSELIQKACKEGPQEISVRGKVKAVLTSANRP
jgi:prevent-host-death family protein